MPYSRPWVPAVVAAAHVMRVDGCDRATAMRQVQAAARDGALRWARGSSNRWNWDAEVLWVDLNKLWPQPRDPAASVRGQKQHRIPDWAIWKHVPEVKPYEAVALSLNIEPSKVRRPPLSWATGRQMFDEDQAFKDRLFVLERNLEVIGARTFVNVPGWDEYTLIRVQAFAVWAKSIGWPLPAEFEEIAAAERADRQSQHRTAVNREPHAEPEPTPTRVRTSTKREAFASWLAKKYPDGVPPGMSQKDLAKQFKSETGVQVDVRTVRRALGRL